MDTGAEGQGQSLLVIGFRGSRSQASHLERHLACLILSVFHGFVELKQGTAPSKIFSPLWGWGRRWWGWVGDKRQGVILNMDIP